MKENILLISLNRFLVKIALVLIRFYQGAMSPHFPPTCRYLPTCSQYAYEAYDKWGFLKGSYLAVKRLMSCHPFAEAKVDLVPETTLKNSCRHHHGELR